jgi:peroxiredoxin
MTRMKGLDRYLCRIVGMIFLLAGLHDTLTYWALQVDERLRSSPAMEDPPGQRSTLGSREDEAMQRQAACRITAIVAAMGILLLGNTAQATEDLFEAMGMTKLSGKPTTDFTLPTLNGTQVSLQMQRGKVVFLNFWATWCIPCREEMPAMEQLHQTFGLQGLVVLAVNLKESPEQGKAFMDKYHLSFTVLLDHDGSVFRDYAVMGLPTTYLIGREGTLLAQGVGGRDGTKAEGKGLIRALLAAGSVESSWNKNLELEEGH